jgi:hypothetical protein
LGVPAVRLARLIGLLEPLIKKVNKIIKGSLLIIGFCGVSDPKFFSSSSAPFSELFFLVDRDDRHLTLWGYCPLNDGF